MSIGDTLAEARRQAGLTITQVSKRTRVRESIISSIEQGDFSPCGGDFYARGHIRSIASVVGADPAPLIREYDEEHGQPGSMRAAQIFEPATPIRIREPRSLHLGPALAVVVLAAAGYGAYHVYSGHSASTAATPTARLRSAAAKPAASPPASQATPAASATPSGSATVAAPETVIQLTATQACWVGLTSATGQSLYQGVIAAGSSKTWTEKQPATMVIGNPPGIKLTVNGKPEKLNTVKVVTLSINPMSKIPVTGG